MTFVPDLAYNNATTKNVNGKDVTYPPDWSQINPLPDAALFKASEFNGWGGFTDITFAANWHGAGALNIPRAAYHFYHNGMLFYNSGKQARYFVSVIQANGMKANDFFVLDNEEQGKVSISESLDWFYNVKIGLGLPDYSRFLLYSTSDILNNLNLSKFNADQLAILKQIRKWVAGYPNTLPAAGWQYPNYKGYQLIPAMGQAVIWQYAENQIIPTIPGGVDVNQIDPTFLSEWQAGMAPNAPTTPQEPPTPQTPPDGGSNTSGAKSAVIAWKDDNGVILRTDEVKIP